MGSAIWSEGTGEYKQEPLTDEMIREAEEALRIKLPDSYISLLREQNGGYIEFDSHPADTPNSWADDHVNVDYIMGIGKENGILESQYYIDEWDLPNDIVLISGGGRSWIALDYRKTQTDPPVIFIDSEQEQIFDLAPDFGTFLTQLTNWEEDGGEGELYVKEKRGLWSRLFKK